MAAKRVKLNNVRLAFPVLFTPKSVNGEGEAAFSASFLFAKDSQAYKAMVEAIQEVGKEEFGVDWPSVYKTLQAGDKLCLHNGDAKADYEGYAGNYYVSARNKARPGVFDRDPNVALEQVDGRPYAGCYVNASLELWVQNNKYGKRINASLRGVQFYADGDAFTGGGSATSEDFEDLSNGSDAAAYM